MGTVKTVRINTKTLNENENEIRAFVRNVMPTGTKRDTLQRLQGYVLDTDKPFLEVYYGAYYRYMDLTDKKLMVGGFLSDDNGYTVALSNHGRTFKITRKNRVFFRKVGDKEKRYKMFQSLS
jgi:hypothetical protein